MSSQYGELGPLAAEIGLVVWGSPANCNGFHVLAALLHGTVVVGISQTLRHWTEGATYSWQGGHHVGHWPTFLVFFWVVVNDPGLLLLQPSQSRLTGQTGRTRQFLASDEITCIALCEGEAAYLLAFLHVVYQNVITLENPFFVHRGFFYTDTVSRLVQWGRLTLLIFRPLKFRNSKNPTLRQLPFWKIKKSPYLIIGFTDRHKIRHADAVWPF